MSNPERRDVVEVNIMASFTMKVLEGMLNQARTDLRKAQLAIGEAAGRESNWHDNAAFDHANIDYDLKSARLAKLLIKLQNVEIIAPRLQIDRIDIGNTVIVKFEEEKQEETFTILGLYDSEKKQGWLSYASPLGKSLIGKEEGKTVEYSVAGKKQRVRVIKILPGDFE